MVSNYELKKSPVDPNRLRRYAKTIIDDSSEDRKGALDLYYTLKKEYDEYKDTAPGIAKDIRKHMIDCLKLAQTSKTNSIKLIESMVKLELALAAKGVDKDEETSTSINWEMLDESTG